MNDKTNQTEEEQKVFFHPNSKEYTKKSLEPLTKPNLLKLRNQVAKAVKASPAKDFKDQATGIKDTWNMLLKYNTQVQTTTDKAKPTTSKGAGKQGGKAQKPRPPQQGAKGKPNASGTEFTFVKRPKREMFDKVRIVRQPKEEEVIPRRHRWKNYTDGMMLIDVFTKEGCIAWDVKEWCKLGLMKMEPVSDADYEKVRAAWFKSQNRDDPLILTQKNKAEAKAKEKAETKAIKNAKK